MGRKAPVQGEGPHWLRESNPHRKDRVVKPPGLISWEEHEKAHQEYARRHSNDQTAERLAQRGGFGYLELVSLLGGDPETWEPRNPK